MLKIVQRQVKDGPAAVTPRLPPIGHHAESTAQIGRKVGTQWSNHSQFNRDPDIWIGVSDVVLWELAKSAIASKDRNRQRLEVWSCGCSSGEEVYFMRMMWLQRFQNIFPELNLKVIGTDISADVIAACKRGQYENHSVSVIPKDWQEVFFDQQTTRPYSLPIPAALESVNKDHQALGGTMKRETRELAAASGAEAFRAARREKFEGAGSAAGNTTSRHLRADSPVRRMVEFVQQDNRKEMPEGPFDLITCRYALVLYTKENLWHHLTKLVDRLRTGGFLVIGKTENLPVNFADKFHLVRVLHPGGQFQLGTSNAMSQDQIPGVYQKMSASQKTKIRQELGDPTAFYPSALQEASRLDDVREMSKTLSSATGAALNAIKNKKKVVNDRTLEYPIGPDHSGTGNDNEDRGFFSGSTSAGSSGESDRGTFGKRAQSLGTAEDEARIAKQKHEMEVYRRSGTPVPGGTANSRPATPMRNSITSSLDDDTRTSSSLSPMRNTSNGMNKRSQSVAVSFGSGDVTGKRAEEMQTLAAKVRKPLQKPVFFVPKEDANSSDPRLRCGTYGNFLRQYRQEQPDWVRYQKEAAARLGRPRIPMLDRSKEILLKSSRQSSQDLMRKTINIYKSATESRLGGGTSNGKNKSDEDSAASGTDDADRNKDDDGSDRNKSSSKSAKVGSGSSVPGGGTFGRSTSGRGSWSSDTRLQVATRVSSIDDPMANGKAGTSNGGGAASENSKQLPVNITNAPPQPPPPARSISNPPTSAAKPKAPTGPPTSTSTSNTQQGGNIAAYKASLSTSLGAAVQPAAVTNYKAVANKMEHQNQNTQQPSLVERSKSVPVERPPMGWNKVDYTAVKPRIDNKPPRSIRDSAVAEARERVGGTANTAGAKSPHSANVISNRNHNSEAARNLHKEQIKAELNQVQKQLQKIASSSTTVDGITERKPPSSRDPRKLGVTTSAGRAHVEPAPIKQSVVVENKNAEILKQQMELHQHQLQPENLTYDNDQPTKYQEELERTRMLIKTPRQQGSNPMGAGGAAGPSTSNVKNLYQTYGISHLRPQSPPNVANKPMKEEELVDIVNNLTAKHRPDRPPTPCRDKKMQQRKKRSPYLIDAGASPLKPPHVVKTASLGTPTPGQSALRAGSATTGPPSGGFGSSSSSRLYHVDVASDLRSAVKTAGAAFPRENTPLMSRRAPGVEYARVPFTPTRVGMVSLAEQQTTEGHYNYRAGGVLNDLPTGAAVNSVKALRPPKERPLSPTTKLLMKNHEDLTAQWNEKLQEDHVSLTSGSRAHAREILSRSGSRA